MISKQLKNKEIQLYRQLSSLCLETDILFRTRIMAMVVYKNIVVSVEKNTTKTHPLQYRHSNGIKPYLHAETHAIVKARQLIGTDRLRKSTLYVARMYRNGQNADSKPCISCFRVIQEFRIPTVIYYLNPHGIVKHEIATFT